MDTSERSKKKGAVHSAFRGGRNCAGAGDYPDQSEATLMVSRERARQLALALPEAVERDHHGRPSFRVADKIFATLWDEEHMNVMLDEGGILTAVQMQPETCEEVWWGKRLAAVRVNLARADAEMLADLLADAWERRAPKRLLHR
jgi:hypothetical protein